MSNTKKTAVDTASSFLDGVDVSKRLDGILVDINLKTGFIKDSEIWRSTYYGSDQIGTVLYKGNWEGKRAVLKIQGVKPETSEIVMVKEFDKQNESKIVRPPKFYSTLPWDNELEYEAIIMEEVNGGKVIKSKELQTSESLDKFFVIYKEYRANCINKPWIGVAEYLGLTEAQTEKTKQMLSKLKPDSRLRKPEDLVLASEATITLNKAWTGKKSQFMHGHFSAEDLIEQGNEVILFSNLFWKWKHEFFDAVFAYHYCMINLTYVESITKDVFDAQRKLWLKKIYDLTRSEDSQRMVLAALLERMVACLQIDGIMFTSENYHISEHLIETTRSEILRLTRELSS